jgi:hypothetical protein
MGARLVTHKSEGCPLRAGLEAGMALEGGCETIAVPDLSLE